MKTREGIVETNEDIEETMEDNAETMTGIAGTAIGNSIADARKDRGGCYSIQIEVFQKGRFYNHSTETMQGRYFTSRNTGIF